MENPAKGISDVPMWVWLLLAVVVFIAFTSHNSSQVGGTVTVDDAGAAAATSQLQSDQLNAATAISLKLLDIAGAEDLASIDARTREIETNAGLEAIRIGNQPQPPQQVVVTVAGGTRTSNTATPTPSGPTFPIPDDWRKIRYDPTTGAAKSAATQSLTAFHQAASVGTRNVRVGRRGVMESASGDIGALSLGPSVF